MAQNYEYIGNICTFEVLKETIKKRQVFYNQTTRRDRVNNANRMEEILRLHALWLEGKEGGQRANLRCADLRDADLSGADLSGADLRCADLRGADLSGAKGI